MCEFRSFDTECITVEYAKSNRSECKSCQQKIEMNELRIGHTIVFDPEHMISNRKWFHLRCFEMPEKFQKKKPKFYEFENADQLEEKDRQIVIKQFGLELGDESMIPDLKPKFHANKEIKKFEDQVSFTAQQYKEYTKLQEQLSGYTIKDLSEMLQKNQMSGGSKKEQLVQKIAECKILGRRPDYCPRCGGQNLRFYLNTATYYCPGYLDDISWLKCESTIPLKEIEREKWVD